MDSKRIETIKSYMKLRLSGGTSEDLVKYLADDTVIDDKFNGDTFTGIDECKKYYDKWRPGTPSINGDPKVTAENTIVQCFDVYVFLVGTYHFTATFYFVPDSVVLKKIVIAEIK